MAPNYGEDVPYQVVEDGSSREQRRGYWVAASSLQEADGLSTSKAAEGYAREYISGRISSSELSSSLEELHGGIDTGRHKEADVVAGRIVRLLELGRFDLSPRSLIEIHSSLFAGVFDPSWVGRFREVNLSKEESVLGGRSVQYCDWGSIFATLEYDFGVERARKHEPLTCGGEIANISRFIANVWQTHPFREGNTRTCAVFCELYLRSFGCQVDNEPFAENGMLFRDALVRANWSSIPLGIAEEPKFLQAFIGSIVNGTEYPYTAKDLNLHGIRETGVPYREDGRATLPVVKNTPTSAAQEVIKAAGAGIKAKQARVEVAGGVAPDGASGRRGQRHGEAR